MLSLPVGVERLPVGPRFHLVDGDRTALCGPADGIRPVIVVGLEWPKTDRGRQCPLCRSMLAFLFR